MPRAATLDPSQYRDSFARDRLPPPELWPDLGPLPAGAAAWPRRVNAAVELLDGAVARGFGERPCLHTVETTWTYRALRDAADRIAATLVADYGLEPGNRVLLRGANSPMLAACWFGVLKAGGIAVTTMPLLRARELVAIAAKAAVQIALCDAALAQELEAARAACPTLRDIGYFHSAEAHGLEARMARRSAGFADVIPSQDDVALIAFTSGTTGRPKATMHFHRDILAICEGVPRSVLGATPEDVVAGSAPLGFTYGLGSLLLFPIRCGAASVLLERSTAERLLETVARFRVTILMTGPTLYRAMTPLAPRFDLSSLRMACSSGEHLPAAVFDGWRAATGLPLRNLLGSTEMLHAFVATPADGGPPGSTGAALPGYRVRVVDEAMTPAPPGAIGRLAVQGPTGCRYLDDPAQQKVYVVDGWNLTGDAFRLDEDGVLWYHARTDEMIVSSGYNISGAEVEAALLEHPAVRECAVVGIPDPARGSLVKAFVVPRDPAAADSALALALQDFVKAVLAPYKYPRAVEFVASLPLTATGKIQRAALRAPAPAHPEEDAAR